MNDEYSTQVKVTIDSKYGNLKDYPRTSLYSFEFDATDLNINGYVEQFRTALRAAGFGEKSIADALGEF